MKSGTRSASGWLEFGIDANLNSDSRQPDAGFYLDYPISAIWLSCLIQCKKRSKFGQILTISIKTLMKIFKFWTILIQNWIQNHENCKILSKN
jgi:hypothetical protein